MELARGSAGGSVPLRSCGIGIVARGRKLADRRARPASGPAFGFLPEAIVRWPCHEMRPAIERIPGRAQALLASCRRVRDADAEWRRGFFWDNCDFGRSEPDRRRTEVRLIATRRWVGDLPLAGFCRERPSSGGSGALAAGSSSAKARIPKREAAGLRWSSSRARRVALSAVNRSNQFATCLPAEVHAPQWYGSAASRSPSPKKLKARTVMMTQATGSISHG